MNIQLNKINFFYGFNQVLNNINLTCSTGEIMVILGRSGSGKTSLLRVFNLLITPHSGQLIIAGYQFDFNSKPKINKIRILRQKVGMIFQQYYLWPHLTVIENIIKAPCLVLGLNKNIAKQKAIKFIHLLQLDEVINCFPAHLSGGQQQRVAIARALIMEPQILLFDEPTSALDLETTSYIINIIQELSKTGITQLIVTHQIDFALKIASKIIYMEKGVIIEQGNIKLFDKPKTQEFANYLSYLSS